MGFHVEATVRLTGVTVAQFTASVKSHFVSLLAKNLEVQDTTNIMLLGVTAVARRRRRQLLAAGVDVHFDVAVVSEWKAMWTATKISSWVADTSTSGFKKMLNAETPSSVTIASTSVSKAPTTVLHGTAAPTAAPDSFINDNLSTASLIIAIIGAVAIGIVLVILVIAIVLISVQLKNTRNSAEAAHSKTKRQVVEMTRRKELERE
jgi:hypothetical protein